MYTVNFLLSGMTGGCRLLDKRLKAAGPDFIISDIRELKNMVVL